MSDKYIIKNCPAYIHRPLSTHDRVCLLGDKVKPNHKELYVYCKDITDCVLKQIVELCNIPNCLCDNCDGVGYFDSCADKDCAFYCIMQIQAKLEIEEVE